MKLQEASALLQTKISNDINFTTSNKYNNYFAAEKFEQIRNRNISIFKVVPTHPTLRFIFERVRRTFSALDWCVYVMLAMTFML